VLEGSKTINAFLKNHCTRLYLLTSQWLGDIKCPLTSHRLSGCPVRSGSINERQKRARGEWGFVSPFLTARVQRVEDTAPLDAAEGPEGYLTSLAMFHH
jgi:hypothetical protein